MAQIKKSDMILRIEQRYFNKAESSDGYNGNYNALSGSKFFRKVIGTWTPKKVGRR